MLTADTITDEQIRELQKSTGGVGLTWGDCDLALRYSSTGRFWWGEVITAEDNRRARARCAEILEARRKEGK